jgi:hypothetical protein
MNSDPAYSEEEYTLIHNDLASSTPLFSFMKLRGWDYTTLKTTLILYETGLF